MALAAASRLLSLKNLETFPWIVRLAASGELNIIGAWFDSTLGELYVYDGDSWELEKVEVAD